mmetsp:Transcript_31398/g.89656  ORF Transcript_31398/g.89656 Transcript_31398/m.89656 type:complete len:242 (-) Transcript_31398:898-1623(-)
MSAGPAWSAGCASSSGPTTMPSQHASPRRPRSTTCTWSTAASGGTAKKAGGSSKLKPSSCEWCCCCVFSGNGASSARLPSRPLSPRCGSTIPARNSVSACCWALGSVDRDDDDEASSGCRGATAAPETASAPPAKPPAVRVHANTRGMLLSEASTFNSLPSCDSRFGGPMSRNSEARRIRGAKAKMDTAASMGSRSLPATCTHCAQGSKSARRVLFMYVCMPAIGKSFSSFPKGRSISIAM